LVLDVRSLAMALDYFKPLSKSNCNKIVQETLQAIKTHSAPESTSETGAFGWRDLIRLDAVEHCVRFVTCKALRKDSLWDKT
jgi:hypothetical protein